MITAVWKVHRLSSPESYALHATERLAYESVGTEGRKYYSEPCLVKLDVVFVIVDGGYAEEGGGRPRSIHHTHAGAKTELARTVQHHPLIPPERVYDEDDKIEVWEVEK